MTTVNITFTTSIDGVANWNEVTGQGTTGQKIADLLDDSGASTGLSLWVTTAFTNSFFSSSIATAAAHGIPEIVWDQVWYSDGSAAFEIRGFSAGQTGTIDLAGAGGNATRDTNFIVNGGTPILYDAAGTGTPTAPVSIPFTADGSGVVSVTGTFVSSLWYLNLAVLSYSTGPSATISNLDTDNSVTTYQQANANGVSGFGGPITSGTLGGEAVTIIDGDWQSNGGVVSLRVPGNLATGTFDLVLSDGTDSATLSGVTFTQEWPYEAPYGQVDSNSDWSGQVVTEGTRWKVTREFEHITYDYVAGAAETPPFGNDINDHAEADVGYSGDDSQERQVIYSDGTTATYTVSVSVGEGGIDVYPFSKSIKYAATKNWTWGKRHPMTSMRVRIFK